MLSLLSINLLNASIFAVLSIAQKVPSTSNIEEYDDPMLDEIFAETNSKFPEGAVVAEGRSLPLPLPMALPAKDGRPSLPPPPVPLSNGTVQQRITHINGIGAASADGIDPNKKPAPGAIYSNPGFDPSQTPVGFDRPPPPNGLSNAGKDGAMLFQGPLTDLVGQGAQNFYDGFRAAGRRTNYEIINCSAHPDKVRKAVAANVPLSAGNGWTWPTAPDGWLFRLNNFCGKVQTQKLATKFLGQLIDKKNKKQNCPPSNNVPFTRTNSPLLLLSLREGLLGIEQEQLQLFDWKRRVRSIGGPSTGSDSDSSSSSSSSEETPEGSGQEEREERRKSELPSPTPPEGSLQQSAMDREEGTDEKGTESSEENSATEQRRRRMGEKEEAESGGSEEEGSGEQ
uniref:Uncharacterized protein n=1 Tax=Globodera rostochiensis TaxID=31243 RepID=A0A914IAU3_GLORO